MGTRYRVSVERIDDVEGSEYGTRDTLLFEATVPSAERLASFASSQVRDALAEAAFNDEFPTRVIGGAVSSETTAEPAGRVSAEPSGEAVESAAPEAEKPKRARRTKAQIAADEAAARAATDVVVSNGQAATQVGEVADTVAESAVAQQLGSLVAGGPVAPAGVPITPAADEPLIPFNPFAAKA